MGGRVRTVTALSRSRCLGRRVAFIPLALALGFPFILGAVPRAASGAEPPGGAGGVPSNQTADFGFYVQPAAIGNYVWLDEVGDGRQDAGEVPIPNVQVTLTITYPDGAVTTLVTYTDAGGAYSFGNLLLDENHNGVGPGEPTFVLTFATPAGLVPTGANLGGDDTIDSDGTVVPVFPLQGQTISTYDSGFKEALPTGVVIVSFAGTTGSDLRVTLNWETASEAGILGFHIYRSTDPDTGFERITPQLVAARGGTTQGATYSLEDRPGVGAFHYRLEGVDTGGRAEWYGQVRVEARVPRTFVCLPFLARN
jgi:hypothetical protein